MSKRKRFTTLGLSLILILLMVFQSTITLAAEQANKETKTYITRAVLANQLNKIFKFQQKSAINFTDIKDNAWYKNAALKVDVAGIMNRDNQGRFHGNKTVTRQELALILCRAFHLLDTELVNTKEFTDYKSVGESYKQATKIMVQKGYMSTLLNNKFAPEMKVTKEEMDTIIAKLTGEIKSKAGTYQGIIKGNVVINTANVNLKAMTIYGDLYITEGVGEGIVTLDGVIVKGRTIVLGGGSKSIKFNNSKLLRELLIAKVDGNIRVVASGNTQIAKTKVATGAILVNTAKDKNAFGNITVASVSKETKVVLNGNFSNIKVEADESYIELLKGTIDRMIISNTVINTSIKMEKESKVISLTAMGISKITGEGTIEKVIIKSQGTEIDKEPKEIIIDDHISALIAGTVRTGKSIPIVDATLGGNQNGDGSQSGGDNQSGGGNQNGGGNQSGGGDQNGGGNDTGEEIEEPLPDTVNHVVRIIEFEYVRYIVIKFDSGIMNDYTVTVDGKTVEFSLVTTDGMVVKHEIADRLEHTVVISNGFTTKEYKVK